MANRCVTSGSAHSIERLIDRGRGQKSARRGAGLSGTGRPSACTKQMVQSRAAKWVTEEWRSSTRYSLEQFGGNSASSSPILTGPLELPSGAFVIVHDTTAVEVARRHRILLWGEKNFKPRFFPASTSQPFGS